jgi:hypothetical protein
VPTLPGFKAHTRQGRPVEKRIETIIPDGKTLKNMGHAILYGSSGQWYTAFGSLDSA